MLTSVSGCRCVGNVGEVAEDFEVGDAGVPSLFKMIMVGGGRKISNGKRRVKGERL